ncbi:hypothetical protein NDU88_005307, partial [Pleurodeles waltl]
CIKTEQRLPWGQSGSKPAIKRRLSENVGAETQQAPSPPPLLALLAKALALHHLEGLLRKLRTVPSEVPGGMKAQHSLV